MASTMGPMSDSTLTNSQQSLQQLQSQLVTAKCSVELALENDFLVPRITTNDLNEIPSVVIAQGFEKRRVKLSNFP